MTASGLEIRPLEQGDEQHWRRLWKDYLAFYKTELPETIYALTWQRLMSGLPHEYQGLLALVDGRPVGLAHILFHRSCWLENNACYLQDLYADPEVRGLGIGRALIEAVSARARAEGAGEVHWETQSFNHTAQRLYDRIADKTPFIVYQKTL